MFFGIMFIFAVSLLFFYNYKKHNYWADKGVFSPPSIPILGHLSISSYTWEYADEIYKKAKQYDYSGSYEFFKPKLFIYNPEHIRQITVKDFDHFVDRRKFFENARNEEEKVFHDMLTNTSGEHWKFIRNIITPSFTSGKLKAMFPLISNISDELVAQCRKSSKFDGSNSVDMHELFGQYALDVVACTAFGIEGRSLEEGESSEFYKHVKALNTLSLSSMIKFFIYLLSPKLFSMLGFSVFVKEPSRNLIQLVKRTIAIRQQHTDDPRRGDFVDLILEANKNADKKELKKFEFTENSMIAQSVLFLLAGFDTINNTCSFLINDLAKYPEEQKKIRDELSDLVKNEGFTYQNIMEAKSLDAFISESMRLTPTAYILERCCTKDYRVPEKNLTIQKGELVDIPVWSLHRDPQYWEDPLEFRPSRFLAENKDKIVPYTYLPFGVGPRNCIGNRFALIEMKVAIAKLVLSFEISLPSGFEMKLKKSPQALRPDSNGVMIKMKPLSQSEDQHSN